MTFLKNEIPAPGEPTWAELEAEVKRLTRLVADCRAYASGDGGNLSDLGDRVNKVGRVTEEYLHELRFRDPYHNALWDEAVLGRFRK